MYCIKFIFIGLGFFPPSEEKPCLLLDLDETLVNYSYNKRGYLDEFLEEMSKHFELAIFTASTFHASIIQNANLAE